MHERESVRLFRVRACRHPAMEPSRHVLVSDREEGIDGCQGSDVGRNRGRRHRRRGLGSR